MNQATKPAALLLATLLLSTAAFAGVPSLINYQGRLTNSAGNPLDTTIQMIFSFYGDSTGGSPIWADTVSAVEVTNGLCNTRIIATGIITDSSACFIGIKVGSDPEITPRTRITSAPFALHSATVDGFNPGPQNVDSGLYTFIVGDSNTILSDYSSTFGGNGNRVEVIYTDTSTGDDDSEFSPIEGAENSSFGGPKHTIAGTSSANGFGCIVKGAYSIATWGELNKVDGTYSCIGGGQLNTIYAPANYSVIGGGKENKITAKGGVSVIGGGLLNEATGPFSVIGGGHSNLTTERGATVAGGRTNIAADFYATVGGGRANHALALYSTIAGGGCAIENDLNTSNRVYDNHGTVGGGGDNRAGSDNSIKTDDIFTTIAGGCSNTASRHYTSVGGGWRNNAAGPFATISGGSENTATGDTTVISGGCANNAAGIVSTIGGGTGNYTGVNAGYATISGGSGNMASGNYSAIGGGNSNEASGTFSTIPGGYSNLASGAYSFAAGYNAEAGHSGSFVWSDNSGGAFASTNSNQFLIRASGGVGIGTDAPLATLRVVGNDQSFFERTGSGMTNIISLYNPDLTSDNGVSMNFRSDGASPSQLFAEMDVIFKSHNPMSSEFSFSTRNVGGWGERVRIASNGNTGIMTNAPHSTLHDNGSLAVGYTPIDGTILVPYNVSDTDCVVVMTKLNNETINLPAASSKAGRMYTIKNASTQVGVIVTVGRQNGGDMIDGVAANIPLAQWNSKTFVSDGGLNWYIISSF